ncbi:MAG: winged helix-turn-helix transcriptional regulator [Thermoleophilia bacterium]|nr:winged helix-turn-helix transcriptional regulator [Thermoleophilia bacterium]
MAKREKRPATLAEARALAHPLRQRILRLCLDEELTNKQLADRLDADPGTVIHHVRKLVDTGFLAPGDVRAGPRGALEKPYRATKKSWTLDVTESGESFNLTLAAVDAFRDELAEAGDEAGHTMTRLGLTLNETSRDELLRRLSEVLEEFAARSDDPDGRPYGLLVAIHERAWPRRE